MGGEKGKEGPRTRKGWIGSEKWVKMTEVERKKIFDERRKQKEEERRKVAKTGRPISPDGPRGPYESKVFCPVVLDRKVKLNDSWAEVAGGQISRKIKTKRFSVPEEVMEGLDAEAAQLVQRWKEVELMEAIPECWKVTLKTGDLPTASPERWERWLTEAASGWDPKCQIKKLVPKSGGMEIILSRPIIMDVGKTVGPAVVISSDPMVDDFCIIMLEWMTIGKAESRFAKWFVENGLDNKPLMYAIKDKRMIAIFEGAVKSLEDTDVIEIQSTPFASVV